MAIANKCCGQLGVQWYTKKPIAVPRSIPAVAM
jgi:hypothetical protein